MDIIRKVYADLADQDDCLIPISTGKRPPEDKLRALPPWRAVLIARIACRVGVMSSEEVEKLIEEARKVGGNGSLHVINE